MISVSGKYRTKHKSNLNSYIHAKSEWGSRLRIFKEQAAAVLV